MNALLAIVNLLTVIANAVLNVVRRQRFEDAQEKEKGEVEKLHENPGRYVADMFGARGDDSLRSDAQANKDIYYTNKADPRR